MPILTRTHTSARADVMLAVHGLANGPSVGLEGRDEPVFAVPLPAVLPRRCARRGHRLDEESDFCPACKAIGLWPGLDRRKLSRVAPSVERIARLASRSSSLDIDTIRGMLKS
jgi:hypothetical protein